MEIKEKMNELQREMEAFFEGKERLYIREFPQFLKPVPFFFRRNRPLGLLERQEKARLNNRAKALFLR
jgi:hypothetical protein